MRCHICDRILEKIVLDKRDGKVMPCPGCLEAIAVAEYERAIEELEEEDVLPGLPQSDDDTQQPVEEGLGVGVSVSPNPSVH